MCGVARRAGGPLRARWCAAFVYGAANTNACPPGFSKIILEALCAGAAGVLGRSYTRLVTGSLTSATYPSGCNTGGIIVVFNDHPTGAPRPSFTPLCAGKPLTAVQACVCVRARKCVCVRVCVCA